jgi:hypothetical protein
MDFDLGAFVENSTWELLDKCMKTSLLIAKHYDIKVVHVEPKNSQSSLVLQAIWLKQNDKNVLPENENKNTSMPIN